MDEFLREIHTEIFKKWLLLQDVRPIAIYLDDENSDIVHFDTDYAHGEMQFDETGLIALSIINKKNDQPEFFLHFQMNTLAHAVSLYHEFITAFQAMKDKKGYTIMLSCTVGLTTSFYATLLNEGSQAVSLDYEFDAAAYSELFVEGRDADIILLAPQISYKEAEVKAIFRDKIVLSIPAKLFAAYDVGGMLQIIDQALRTRDQRSKDPDKVLKIRKSIQNPTKILVIAVIRQSERTRLACALYDHNDCVMQQEFLKFTFNLRDIRNIIDATLVQDTDIEMIGISLPGIINEGFLDSELDRHSRIDLNAYFGDYEQTMIFSNDVNAIAAGIYASQETYQTLSFIFTPIGALFDGIGNVIEGKLWEGHRHIAGEAQFLPLLFSDDQFKLRGSVEGMMEVTTRNMLAIIAILAPEAIYYYNEMIVDQKKLRASLSSVIPEDYLPDLIKLDAIIPYALLGEMLICLEKRKKQLPH